MVERCSASQVTDSITTLQWGEWFTIIVFFLTFNCYNVNHHFVFIQAGFVYGSILSIIRLTCVHAHTNWSSFCILSFYNWTFDITVSELVGQRYCSEKVISTKMKPRSADIKYDWFQKSKWCIQQLEVMWKIISTAMKKNHHSLGQAYAETQNPLHGRHRITEAPRSVKKWSPFFQPRQ